MTKRAAIYCRVSTQEQKEDGYGLSAQLAACRKFAIEKGFSINAEFTEDISGASPIAERPQGSQLSEMVKRRSVDIVIIHSVDRLSRDLVDLLQTVRGWLKTDVEICFMDLGKINSDDDITLLIRGWQGTNERIKIKERLRGGKYQKARMGKVVGGRPPYGYQNVIDTKNKIVMLEPNEAEARIVKLVFQLYAYGDDTGKRLSAAEIASRLSLSGITPPGGRNKGYPTERETRIWYSGTILALLANTAYIGAWRYGEKIGRTHNKRPESEIITVEIPAIIDAQTWQAAQNRRINNKRLARRNSKRNYLLSGYIRCGCGLAMTGEFMSNHRYYSCNWRVNHIRALDSTPCKEPSIRADAIEADIWESIVNLFSDLNRFEELLRIAQQDELSQLDPKIEELKTIEAMIKDAEREAAEIGQALKKSYGIVGKRLEQNMKEVDDLYTAYCARRDILRAQIDNQRFTDETIAEALQWAEDIKVGIEDPDFETQRNNLEFLRIQVTIKDRHYYVKSIVGEWDGEIRTLERARKGAILTGSFYKT